MTRSASWSLLALLGLVAVLLLPLGFGGRALKYALDFAHVFVGALLAAAWLVVLRPRMRARRLVLYVVTWFLATCTGAVIEKVQGFVGREASLLDAVTNGLGAAAFLLVLAASAARGRLREGGHALALACLVVAAIVPARHLFDTWRQHRAMPRLAGFEDELEMTRWRFLGSTGRRVHTQVTDGNAALRVHLRPPADGLYPGATLAWFPGDWSAYETLVFDIHLDDGPSLDLTVKIEDEATNGAYEDRYNGEFRLQPGKRTFRIPLVDIQGGPSDRLMDLASIRIVNWFFDGHKTSRVMHLDHVRLEGTFDD